MAIELSRDQDDKNGANKPKRSPRVKKIAEALADIEAMGTAPDCVTQTPGAFLWEFYKAWLENGGQDGGKNRNSIRRMRDVWLVGDQEVKSLHPKLTGRIRISKDDARKLMSLFLSRWTFVGVKEGDWILTSDGYAPFPCRDCRKLCAFLVDAMYPEGSKLERIGLRLPVRSHDPYGRELESEWDEVARLYLQADAVINLSRHKTAVGTTPIESMKNFWEILKYSYDGSHDTDTIYIWIVDIGSRHVEDDESWPEFYNFEVLKSQFRAFATFDSNEDELEEPNQSYRQDRSAIHDAFLHHLKIPKDDAKQRRWKWLCEKTVFAVQNLRIEEFENLYMNDDKDSRSLRLKDIGVTAEHILPRTLPHSWGRQKEIRELYGRDANSMADATITVFLNSKKQNNQISSNIIGPTMRYFAHAAFANGGETDERHGISSAISRELTSPGNLYDEAFGIVYWAAKHRLGRIDRNDRAAVETGSIALAYLRNLRIQMLRIPEFLSIHQSPKG